MAARVRAMQQRRASHSRAAVRDEELFEQLVHDLRNPLGAIAYYAEAVPDAAAAERAELCERLHVNAQRALHVLQEFSLLADLRAGRSEPAPDLCDPGELIDELAAELESMERRSGLIRRQVEVSTALRLPRVHLACTLRALLRELARATAPDDALHVSVRTQGSDVRFELTAVLRAVPELGDVARLPTGGIEIELAERIAALYGGRCTIERKPGRGVITLVLATAA